MFHIALGGIYALAPYLVLSAVAAGLPGAVAAALAILAAAAAGMLAEESIHWPFERKRAPSEVHLIGSLGAYLVIVQSSVSP